MFVNPFKGKLTYTKISLVCRFILATAGIDFISETRHVLSTIPMLFIFASALTVPPMVVIHIKKQYDSGTMGPESLTGVTAFFAAFDVTTKMAGLYISRIENRRFLRIIGEAEQSVDIREKFIYEKYQIFAKRFIIVSCVSYLGAAFTFIMYPLTLGKSSEFELPLAFSVPFLDYRTHPAYELNFMIQTGQLLVVAFIFIGLDGCFIISVAYILNCFDIVSFYLDQIKDTPEDEMDDFIKSIIKKHSETLDFIKESASTMSGIFFMQIIVACLLLCVSLFHISISESMICSSVGMCVTQFIKLLIYCYGGERVVTKANEVAQNIYCANWYEIKKVRNRKLILFMLANAQRNVGYAIGGFGYMSMMAFTQVVKTAYSFNTFLHNMREKKNA